MQEEKVKTITGTVVLTYEIKDVYPATWNMNDIEEYIRENISDITSNFEYELGFDLYEYKEEY